MTKTILVLAANPKNTPPLRLDQEIREIDNGLQRAQKRDEFILKQKLAVRPIDVRRAVLDYKPDIVHFCGHGSGEEGIAFEDENGQAKLVGAYALAGFFELFADKVECVILNACYSEVQAEAIAKHIPYVIGMRQAIGDSAAIEFAVAFYDALGAGEDIEFAYKLACNAIQWANLPEHLTPVLKKHSEAMNGNRLSETQRTTLESMDTEGDKLKDFVEVLQYRAHIILDYIEEQRRSAVRDDWHKEEQYKLIREQFIKLHESYIDAVKAGKSQLAHELLGDIYRLLYRARYNDDREPPPAAMGRLLGD
jgi:hypothetical protein